MWGSDENPSGTERLRYDCLMLAISAGHRHAPDVVKQAVVFYDYVKHGAKVSAGEPLPVIDPFYARVG
jgi:hypothetical protein